jgi:hypothetical protein
VKTHINVGDWPLCGNRSIGAACTAADCQHCCRAFDKILDALFDIVEHQNPSPIIPVQLSDKILRAKELLKKLKLERT